MAALSFMISKKLKITRAEYSISIPSISPDGMSGAIKDPNTFS
jgi:hypothetical protein